MIDLRLPTGPPPPQPRVFPFPPLPAHSPLGPQSGTESTGRSHGPLGGAQTPPPWPRLPPSVGTYIMPPRQRMPCAPRAASLSARSFIPWPACARMCWNRTVRRAIGPQGRYRALLLRSTSALFLRDAHAPVLVFYQVHAQRSRSSPRQIGRSGVGALFYALLRTVRDFRGWQLSKTPKRCVELIVLDP